MLFCWLKWMRLEVCEVNENNYSTIFNQDFGYIMSRQIDPNKIAKYNSDRDAYLEEEQEYQRLLIEKSILDARFKKISFKISNIGTAPTGYMMMFIEIPKDVMIYTREESRYRVDYKVPVKPSNSSFLPMDRETLRTMLSMQNMGNGSCVWLWDPKKDIKNMEFKESSTSIIQNLCRPLKTSFYIDIKTTESFDIRWSIADENLPDMAIGVLKVEITKN